LPCDAVRSAEFRTIAPAQRLKKGHQTMHMRWRRRPGVKPATLLIADRNQYSVKQFLIVVFKAGRII
jgi:hypothetical protein